MFTAGGHALNSIEETLWVECKTNLVGFFGVGYVPRAGELVFFLLNSKSRCFAIWHVPGCLFGIHVILSCKYIPPAASLKRWNPRFFYRGKALYITSLYFTSCHGRNNLATKFLVSTNRKLPVPETPVKHTTVTYIITGLAIWYCPFSARKSHPIITKRPCSNILDQGHLIPNLEIGTIWEI